MRKCLFVLLASILVTSPLFSQTKNANTKVKTGIVQMFLEKFEILKDDYEKLSVAYMAKMDVSFKIKRYAPNGVEIGFEIPTKANCKSGCSDLDDATLKDIISKLPKVIENFVVSLQDIRPRGVIYASNKGVISLKLLEMNYDKNANVDDEINDMLDGIFDVIDVGETISFDLTLVLQKKSNQVITINKDSSIYNIKIPPKKLEDAIGSEKGGGLMKTLLKMQDFSLEGALTIGKTLALKGYATGLGKLVVKNLTSGSLLFDAFIDFKNEDNTTISSPLEDVE